MRERRDTLSHGWDICLLCGTLGWIVTAMQDGAPTTGAGQEPKKWEYRWNDRSLTALMNKHDIGSHRELAKRIGVPHQTLSRQIAKNTPQMDVIVAIVGNFPEIQMPQLIQMSLVR